MLNCGGSMNIRDIILENGRKRKIKQQWKPWGKRGGWKCSECGHIPGTTEPPEKCPMCAKEKKK
jgi:rubrerythrin